MQIPENLHSIPEWRYLGRETALASRVIGSAVTALGRANYADGIGDYYTAFFGLSIGLERLAKLILVADYSIRNGGEMPDEKILRKFGHSLIKLMDEADAVAAKHSFRLEYARPTGPIVEKIGQCLDAFADASRGRYANFGALGDPRLGEEEPVAKWWNEVAQEILAEHFTGRAIESRVRQRAGIIDAMMSEVSVVFHTSEDGDPLVDVFSASFRTGQTAVVQKYGRYYSLTLVRWLCDLLSKIAREAFHRHGLVAFFGLWERLYGYRVDNDVLRSRKRWPLV